MYYDTIISSNIDDLYKQSIQKVIDTGEKVTARGLDFIESRFQHLILTNPRARIVANTARKLSKKFLAAEFIWIMSGSPWLDQIEFYNKRMREFSDDGISLHGAYGPRLRHWSLQHGDVDQLENCLKRLKDDIFTRQAVIIIIDPAVDFTVKTRDVPCNNYLQFLYRDKKLHLMCYVRSNDLFLGFPYDASHWTMLQEMYASALGVEVGEYHHIVGSLHIYENNIEKMKSIATQFVTNTNMPKMPKLESLSSIINELKKVEENYRKTGEFCFDHLDKYWQDFLSWLK